MGKRIIPDFELEEIKLPLKEGDKRIQEGETYLIYYDNPSVWEGWITAVKDNTFDFFVDCFLEPISYNREYRKGSNIKKLFRMVDK